METIKDLYFNDKGFIFDPDSGAIFSLNTTGAFIIKQLQKGVPVKRVLAEMKKDFDVDEGTAQRDLREFLDMLAAFGLLAKAPA
ncbi:MAG: PqqD family protein [Chloroflexi bacterium]|nr:PqqD family protein [Chloroflexota bacterium]